MNIQTALNIVGDILEESAQRGSTKLTSKEHSALVQLLDMADTLSEGEGLDRDFSWWDLKAEEVWQIKKK